MKNSSRLMLSLLALTATPLAFAGGTVAPAPVEAPAAPAPAPAPEVVTPPPAPVVLAPTWAPHFYVGGSIGRTRYSDTGGGSDNATGGKVFAGYQFHPNFAVEAAYADLGSVGGSVRDVRGQGGVIDAVGILPFGAWGHDFNVFGKIGVADMRLKNGVDTGYKAGAHYGVGLGYNFTKALGVRVEAERFQKVGAQQIGFVPGTGTVDFGQARANLYSVGLQYNF
jgi:OmpA-OmpF porin, OOP family